jgi:hypothetical protein
MKSKEEQEFERWLKIQDFEMEVEIQKMKWPEQFFRNMVIVPKKYCKKCGRAVYELVNKSDYCWSCTETD